MFHDIGGIDEGERPIREGQRFRGGADQRDVPEAGFLTPLLGDDQLDEGGVDPHRPLKPPREGVSTPTHPAADVERDPRGVDTISREAQDPLQPFRAPRLAEQLVPEVQVLHVRRKAGRAQSTANQLLG